MGLKGVLPLLDKQSVEFEETVESDHSSDTESEDGNLTLEERIR